MSDVSSWCVQLFYFVMVALLLSEPIVNLYQRGINVVMYGYLLYIFLYFSLNVFISFAFAFFILDSICFVLLVAETASPSCSWGETSSLHGVTPPTMASATRGLGDEAALYYSSCFNIHFILIWLCLYSFCSYSFMCSFLLCLQMFNNIQVTWILWHSYAA